VSKRTLEAVTPLALLLAFEGTLRDALQQPEGWRDFNRKPRAHRDALREVGALCLLRGYHDRQAVPHPSNRTDYFDIGHVTRRRNTTI
jgi:hypothetical protein